jgi:hypothetical protein
VRASCIACGATAVMQIVLGARACWLACGSTPLGIFPTRRTCVHWKISSRYRTLGEVHRFGWRHCKIACAETSRSFEKFVMAPKIQRIRRPHIKMVTKMKTTKVRPKPSAAAATVLQPSGLAWYLFSRIQHVFLYDTVELQRRRRRRR